VSNATIEKLPQSLAIETLVTVLTMLGAPVGFLSKFFKSCWSNVGHHRSFGGVTMKMVRQAAGVLSGWVV
jgi:hypothetical protein